MYPTAHAAFMFNLSRKNDKGKPENLKEILSRFDNLSKEFEELKETNKKCAQKFAVIRFNPFNESGGDQSFSIALLDGNNDGFVITSHYHRDANRVYAKPIRQGQSKYQLSEEEKQAINKAING